MPGRTWRDNGHKALCPLSGLWSYTTMSWHRARSERAADGDSHAIWALPLGTTTLDRRCFSRYAQTLSLRYIPIRYEYPRRAARTGTSTNESNPKPGRRARACARAAARETYKTGARCYVALLFAGCW
eukprot:COSAG02_NODE_3266_length_7057_cov_12.370078_4_plen_128_part_00